MTRRLDPPPGSAPSRSLPVMFAVVSLALLMTSLDSTIVATALHALQTDLDASVTWAGWTLTAYSLGLVLMLPLAGKLSDQYGRRRVFLGSIVLFSTASLCCGLVSNIYLLVALRFIQAIGGAGFTPSATGLVVEHFGAARDRAVGLFGSIFPIGAMIGPILGGVFVTYASWREIFLVNVPVGAALLLLCLRFIPADGPRTVRRKQRPDLVGVALLGVGLLAAMIGLTYLGDTTPSRLWLPIGAFVVAAVALGLFVRHVRHVDNPIIAPGLIYGRGFGAVNVVNIVYGGAVAGLLALLPLYATTRYRISALGSGTLLIAEGVATIVLSTFGAFALRRTGYRRPIYAGSVVIAAGMIALSFAPVGLSPYAWLALVAGVTGMGVGFLNPASRNAGLQLAPEQSASIAALRTTGRQIGTIGSISIATAFIDHATDSGVAQGWVYIAFGLLLLVLLPLISRIPEHRGSW